MAARPTLGGKLLHPSDYIAAEECRDAAGKPMDVTLTIASIRIEEMETDTGKESKPVIRFIETTKKIILNRTNADSIAELYGPEAEQWIGKRITIYPTRVKAWGEMKACIRVRETAPPTPQAAPIAAESAVN